MDTINTFNKKYKDNARGGFVLLYAVLIATVVLSIGLSLLDILIEQMSLVRTERESSLSFYAADSGMECALYWDSDTIIPPDGAFRAGPPWDISCDADTPSVTRTDIDIGGGKHTETYDFKANLSQNACVSVSIKKTVIDAADEVVGTTIQSRGYNTACPPAASAKPWRFERGIKVDY